MTSRPCNPDADTRRLWQLLMPGTPMPSCGTGGNKAPDDEPAEPAPQQPTAKPPRD
jgi:hypothetical protein